MISKKKRFSIRELKKEDLEKISFDHKEDEEITVSVLREEDLEKMLKEGLFDNYK